MCGRTSAFSGDPDLADEEGAQADSEREESDQEPEREESVQSGQIRSQPEGGNDLPSASRPRTDTVAQPMTEPSASSIGSHRGPGSVCTNFYVESEHPDASPFQAEQGEIYLNYNMQSFYIRRSAQTKKSVSVSFSRGAETVLTQTGL